MRILNSKLFIKYKKKNIGNKKLIKFEDEDATAVWIGSHKDYELTFKNNKNTIHKWLRNNGWI